MVAPEDDSLGSENALTIPRSILGQSRAIEMAHGDRMKGSSSGLETPEVLDLQLSR